MNSDPPSHAIPVERSLKGRRVIVTRPADEENALQARLTGLGAIVTAIPLIQILPARDMEPLLDAARRRDRYDWIVFASANGVRMFVDAVRRTGAEGVPITAARIAVVGRATAEEAERNGLRVHAVPEHHRGDAIAAALEKSHGAPLFGVKALLPQANIGRDAAPVALRDRGAQVDVVVAYETHLPRDEDAERFRSVLCAGHADVVTFTSSSIVRNAIRALGPDAEPILSRVVTASIGPSTSHTLHEHGFSPTVEARVHTTDALVDAILDHFHPPGP